MFNYISGTLISKKSPMLVIDVCGIGYEILASMNTICAIGAINTKVKILTYFIVREDSNTIYGFNTESEKILFQELIKVSGVGPKLALTILSGINVDELVRCIEEKDTSRLVKLPGVGKKTAERLIIETKDRLQKHFISSSDSFSDLLLTNNDSNYNIRQDAISALIALGYKSQAASSAVDSASKEISGKDTNSEDLIKIALSKMVG